jgi:hypothetical protein
MKRENPKEPNTKAESRKYQAEFEKLRRQRTYAASFASFMRAKEIPTWITVQRTADLIVASPHTNGRDFVRADSSLVRSMGNHIVGCCLTYLTIKIDIANVI